MSKFEEMCESVAACNRRWIEHRGRCYQNLNRLVAGFKKYCEIPEANICFLPLDKEPKKNTQYNIVGATHFNDNDGYWHLGLCMTLTKNPNVFPKQRVLVAICITEHDGKVMVKRGPEDKPRQLDLDNQSQYSEFYESIVERVKEFFAGGPQEFTDTSASLKRIGFRAES